jgi:hypothetical protein
MRLSILACTCLGALVLTAGASAAAPRVALFDLRTDVAQASHNSFGDLRVWKNRAALAKRAPEATLVRCAGSCTFGKGWLAFKRKPALVSGDIASARAYRIRGLTWALSLELTPRGIARWAAFTRRTAKSATEYGIADALVLAVDGSVAGQPLADQIQAKKGTLRIGALDRWNAVRTAKALR